MTSRADQLRAFGCLTCASCGYDLGDAGDPYRDPHCACCQERSDYSEYLAEQAIDVVDIRELLPACPTLAALEARP
jgi:hypothetical protein